MGSGFSKMKKQAKMMQEQFSSMREQLSSKTAEGSAGNGLVTVTLTGEKVLKKITIRPECVNQDDIEGLQDLIIAAFEDAAKKLDAEGQPMGQLPFF